MVEWLKNNKWLFWIVPIILGGIKLINLINSVRLNKADSQLKDALDAGADSKKSQAVHEARSDSHLERANELRDRRGSQADAGLDWHKNYKE
jgi:hypothetical protein